MKIVDLTWLQKTNEELINQGIIDGQDKIWKACQKWRDENVSDLLKDETADYQVVFKHLEQQDQKIEDYFLTPSLKKRGWIELPFVGIYYFQGNFWEITVPFILGRARINLVECLKMPNELKKTLFSDKERVNEFILVSCDCLDYGLGMGEINRVCTRDFSRNLFGSGDKHLRSTISLLNQEKESSKAIDDARMTIEIFQKAYISAKDSKFTDKEAKKLSHNLEEGLDACVIGGLTELSKIKGGLSIFPAISARYDSSERSLGELWNAYKIAQFIATMVVRDLTGRDSRPFFEEGLK